jgi:hypothetical protein
LAAQVSAKANGHEKEPLATAYVDFLLTEFLDGHSPPADQKIPKEQKERVRRGFYADVALGNFDVAGQDFTNLLVTQDV